MTDGDQALPERTHGIIGHVKVQDRHPGLQLDKLSVAANQQEQAVALKRVCDAARDEKLLAELLSRRALQFEKFQDPLIQFDAETSSPLTLYLARASALENAGICLHPLYGFAYLPASGLKGMARAYAETVWAPASGNGLEAWTKIERVFGWAPTSENRKRWRPDLAVPDGASAGSVVFHDAWPTRWPPLFVDIVNNHHSEYYAGNDAPGDWENPIPIYFLAVQSRATFLSLFLRAAPTLAKTNWTLPASFSLVRLHGSAQAPRPTRDMDVSDSPANRLHLKSPGRRLRRWSQRLSTSN